MVAVDFTGEYLSIVNFFSLKYEDANLTRRTTASNGDPQFANSLHAMQPMAMNQYQHALQSVGQVLLEYDTDKMVAAYGYGARLPPDHKTTSHCFPLNFSDANPEVPGIGGLMSAYQNAISQVKLYGPTNMAPLLRTAQAIASHRQHEYLVVLVVTDGVIRYFFLFCFLFLVFVFVFVFVIALSIVNLF